MKEQFINYNQALKIKELGFNKQCLALYDLDGRITVESVNWSNAIAHKENYLIPAPLWQQAFKWVSEKYNLNGYIMYSKSCDWKFIIDDIVSDDVVIEVLYFKTQEEAMLNCLDKLLEKASFEND